MRYMISSSLAIAACVTAPAFADVPRVVTDIAPVYSLVAAVMGDLGQPELLVPQGASEHNFQLRPSQMSALSDADLVVMVGPELTLWLEKPLAARPSTAATLELLHLSSTDRRDFDKSDDEDGHDHDHDHDHADDEHDHDGIDPHAWLDPDNAEAWLEAIAVALGQLDGVNAATYSANAQAAIAKVEEADDKAALLLAPFVGQTILTYHDAFGYFIDHYQLGRALSIAAGDAATPGAAHLSALQHQIAAGATACLFPETGTDAAAITRLAEDRNVRIGAPLDPLGSALPLGATLYPELITSTAQAIADCLQPS